MVKVSSLYNADRVVSDTFDTLMRDFSPYLPPILRQRYRLAAADGIKGLRNMRWPTAFACGAGYFKRQYQCETLLKRYIFKDDVYTNDELSQLALEDFRLSQDTFGVRRLSKSTIRVVKHARCIVANILGEFSEDRWFSHIKPGKNAAIGLPRSDAYLHRRCEGFTGTAMQVSAWEKVCGQDPHLAELTRKSGGAKEIPSTLTVTAVSKTWKSMRVIAPDSVIGGFLSLGLGSYVRELLEDETHLNFATGKQTHMRIACTASRTGKMVTADLSKASDSFVRAHIRMLVPKSWHAALDTCRCTSYQFKPGEAHALTSYMLMGSGYTFPLQTLLFYALIRAIADLLGITARCYVYGDDLIYPHAMHRHVVKALTELGFKINIEKTFSDVPFRESCGGDYLRGYDVRPFMPETSRFPATKYGHTCWLYTYLNGLLSRWHWWDVSETCEYLLQEIVAVEGTIRIVHPDDADFSGLKYHEIPLKHLRVSWPERTTNGRVYTCFTLRPSWEVVSDSLPYLWNALRSASSRESIESEFLVRDKLHDELLRVVSRDLPGSTQLSWRRVEPELRERGRKAGNTDNVLPCVVSRTRPMVTVATRINSDPCWTSVDWYKTHPQRLYMRIGEFALKPLRLRHIIPPHGWVMRFPVRGVPFDAVAAVSRFFR